jgi:hypothetical protein
MARPAKPQPYSIHSRVNTECTERTHHMQSTTPTSGVLDLGLHLGGSVFGDR